MTFGIAGSLIAVTTIRLIQKYFPDKPVINYTIAVVLLLIGFNWKKLT